MIRTSEDLNNTLVPCGMSDKDASALMAVAKAYPKRYRVSTHLYLNMMWMPEVVNPASPSEQTYRVHLFLEKALLGYETPISEPEYSYIHVWSHAGLTEREASTLFAIQLLEDFDTEYNLAGRK